MIYILTGAFSNIVTQRVSNDGILGGGAGRWREP